MKAKALGLTTALTIGLVSTGALAVPTQIDFTATGGSISGTGYVIVDSDLLDDGPITYGSPSGPTGLTGLDAMMLTLSGIPSVPASTTFTKANLSGYYLTLNSANVITDLNFFMTDVNADGYQYNGEEVFFAGLYQGVPGAEREFLGNLEIRLTSVPEPATLALLGLGLAGLGAVRRKKLAA
jgi:hypothetical protein